MREAWNHTDRLRRATRRTITCAGVSLSMRKPLFRLTILCLTFCTVLVGIGLVCFYPDSASKRARAIICESGLRILGEALFRYANDCGSFPSGAHSPLPALVAGGYIRDPEQGRCPFYGQDYKYLGGTPPWLTAGKPPTCLVVQSCPCSRAAAGGWPLGFFTDASIRSMKEGRGRPHTN